MSGKEEEPDPQRWLEAYGDYLYRFALVRLRDPSMAEDAVQETLLAAWKGWASFAHHASVRTWLTGILKHKIIDLMRKHARDAELYAPDEVPETLGDLFDSQGYAKSPARPWGGNPARDLERKEFWLCLEGCISRLSQKLATVFVLHEVDGLDREEICKALGISPTNYWVILHRARLQLRSCLERNWFLRENGDDA